MLETKLTKGSSSRKNNRVVRSRKRKEVDFGTIFKFVIYGILSAQVGIIYGLICHLLY